MTNNVSSVEVNRPPTTTAASGRCTLAPMPLANSSGSKRRIATEAKCRVQVFHCAFFSESNCQGEDECTIKDLNTAGWQRTGSTQHFFVIFSSWIRSRTCQSTVDDKCSHGV